MSNRVTSLKIGRSLALPGPVASVHCAPNEVIGAHDGGKTVAGIELRLGGRVFMGVRCTRDRVSTSFDGGQSPRGRWRASRAAAERANGEGKESRS